jgi:transposase
MKRTYTEEFRKMAVELSYNSDKPLTDICKELGLSGSILYKWRKDMGNESKPLDSQEIKDLKKKLANLEVENQILKKALAICNRM